MLKDNTQGSDEAHIADQHSGSDSEGKKDRSSCQGQTITNSPTSSPAPANVHDSALVSNIQS